MPVVPRAQFQGQRAGGLDALRAVALAQAEQPQAAAVAVLGIAESLQQLGDEVPGVRADGGSPMDEPLGRPLLVCAIGPRRGPFVALRPACVRPVC